MLTAGQLENVSLPFEKTFSVLQSRILLDVIERIKKNGAITRAADWRIYRLHELGISNAVIKDAIKHALSMSESQIDKLYDDAVASGYAYDESIYVKMGVPFTPYKDNKVLQQLVDAVKRQTLGEMVNITNSLGFAEKTKNGIKFTPIAKYYQQTLDSTMTDIASGAFSYNEVIGRTVKQLTDSGLRTVDYATGHSNRVDVAARRAVMTGFNQVTANINDQNAEALGADHFEVSYHLGARPEHQVWQGRVYSKTELETVCGLGTVTGLCGANCRHSYSPFIPGISVRTYTDEELDEMNAKANTPREWGGKQYTQYEATQRQRQLETTMRAERERISLLEKAGADESDIIAARAKYRVTSSEYTRFSKVMDLPQQRDRVTVDGLGNIGVGKYKMPLTNAAGHPIIKVNKTTLTAEANSITQYTNSKGAIDRNYYGPDSKQKKQISNTDHGHKKESKFGKHGEHAHDYYIDENGLLKHGVARELTDEEREENSDIL